ncbi:MAG: UDP-N-acetylmuramoyl-L-alanine--D-glutamate ligase, partial [Desulfobacula sp.]|nr:UDP-N-acetylmuramoyl-L-alanine--D-glutamate ligase [Desulfobacula sp.]
LNNGVNLTGELDIFTKYNDLPVIAITGTNGKTTVTTLIGNILEQSRMNPFVGGNIGIPLVEHLMSDKTLDKKGKIINGKRHENSKTTAKEIIVAEISSFQLDISKNFKPDIGVLLNISQDHLDRYEDYADYTNSKWSIFKNQNSKDRAVINASIDSFEKKSNQLKPNIISFSSKNLKTAGTLKATHNKRVKVCNARVTSKNIKIKLKTNEYIIPTENLKELEGIHNKENIAAAALACLLAGADFNSILKGLKIFKNLSHRLEFIKNIQGVAFYNDSKATNINAVIRAIECFKKNIIIILGGREKQTDFSLLSGHIKASVKNIIAMGETRQIIKQTFEKICPVKMVQSMKNAVQTAFNMASKNDIVLLSPGCASFDMYENYPARGNDFINCVKALEQG